MVAVVSSHQRAAVVSPRRMAEWDATARRRQEEAVEEPRQVLFQVPLMARHAAAPWMQEVETAVAVAVVAVVASDATAPPQEVAAMAGSGAMERPPAEAARDAQVERLPVGAAAVRHVEAAAAAEPHAVVEVEAGAAAQVVVAPRREAAVARAEVELRQVVEEAPAAREAAPAAAPSAAASVFHQGQLRPAAPQPAARSVREKRGLRNASRSARSSQAAQDEVWSWRSQFLESLL
jgi:hypothetical protein